jgi:hypothetical protein
MVLRLLLGIRYAHATRRQRRCENPTPDPTADLDTDVVRDRESHGSINVLVDLDEEERRRWAEYYGRKIHPRRLLV